MKTGKQWNGSLNITGKMIKSIRIQNKITQEDLCARMQVMGYQISRSDISKLEHGKRLISDYELIGFSRALKVSLLSLFPKDYLPYSNSN